MLNKFISTGGDSLNFFSVS